MAVTHPAARALLTEPLTLDAAYDHCRAAALQDGPLGMVGLEAETHLVDLDDPGRRVPWDRAEPLPDALRPVVRSAVTLEPGAQLELSALPAPDVLAAVTGLRHDLQGARLALTRRRLGLVHAGTDLLRAAQRVNPRPRYQAMEAHYGATGRAGPGAVMMTSTAALQVNLDAGPRPGWAQRVARAHRIGPALVAISACSPWLHGRDTGWKSARQRAWSGLDPRSCGQVPGCVAASSGADGGLDPAGAWADFALNAPVVFVCGAGDQATAVRSAVSFARWASGAVRLGDRGPTAADLDVHLTTLFPPVRLRGYLELRYLDMTPPRWWPAVAAVTATLMDDPAAADLAAEATEASAGLWTSAARDGLADPRLARAARRCLAIAADRVPADLAPAVADLAELVESGRCPGDLLAGRIAQVGAPAAFEELAHA
jgi:glutamate--cysteine ligase